MPNMAIILPMVLVGGTLIFWSTPFAILKPHSLNTSISFAWLFIVAGY